MINNGRQHMHVKFEMNNNNSAEGIWTHVESHCNGVYTG